MKLSFLFLSLFASSAFAADLKSYSCYPNTLYPYTDLGEISIRGEITKNDVKSITELKINGVKQVVRAGASENVYFYAMEGATRKLAFEISYEGVNTDLSFENELKLYVYGKSSWSQHADPIPAFEIATYKCKRI